MASTNIRLQRLRRFLASPLFFGLTIGLFVFEAAWIALSARYPQAFDEQFHFGLIQLYSHHLSPFLQGQPDGANQFGAVARDPSYLYHYLMSFPYRLIEHATGNQTAQVISLRLLNIAFFASSFFVFRKVLRYTKASPAMIHFALFCFALTPVTPLLASQINYDNIFIPLTGLSIWLTLRILERQKRGGLTLQASLGLIMIWLLGSILKYAFLTVAGAEFIFLALSFWKQRPKLRLRSDFVRAKARNLALLLLVLISFGMFSQRYAVNLTHYYTLTPECDQVLSVGQCQSYAPWARNYAIHATKIGSPPLYKLLTFPFVWIYRVMGELVFAVGSSFNPNGTVDYFTGKQLISMEIIGWLVFGIGLVLGIRHWRWLWEQRPLRLFGLVVLCYLAALGGQNLLDYIHLNQITAVHGRYLLPLLPLLYTAIALLVQHVKIPMHKLSPHLKDVTAIVAMLLLITQGGFVAYVVHHDDRWLWQNQTIRDFNNGARTVLKPIAIDLPRQ